jgi:cytoskeletal protein RodZ
VEERSAIGATLREARMRQGIDIGECAAATRIRERYLVAIEDGRYEALPDPAYVNGFIRAYAAHLGVEVPGPARALPEAPEAPAAQSRRLRVSATRVTARDTGTRRRWWRWPLVLLVAAAIAVAVAMWLGIDVTSAIA